MFKFEGNLFPLWFSFKQKCVSSFPHFFFYFRETVDYQLPVQEFYDYPVVPEPEPEPVVKEFKEKTVETIVEFGECSKFKKRKIIGGTKRNIRQRLDD